jgi:hypothetical protein
MKCSQCKDDAAFYFNVFFPKSGVGVGFGRCQNHITGLFANVSFGGYYKDFELRGIDLSRSDAMWVRVTDDHPDNIIKILGN